MVQKMYDDEGKMTDVVESVETSVINIYETDAFKIKIPRRQLDAVYDKIEKIKNQKKITEGDKEKKIKELIKLWVQKKMRPKREIERGEFYHDYVILRTRLFDGYEFKHTQEQIVKEPKKEKKKDKKEGEESK